MDPQSWLFLALATNFRKFQTLPRFYFFIVFASVPSKLKKNGTFGTFFGLQPTKTQHLQIWAQFPSLQKISQNTISLFFQRSAGHIFTIKAALKSQNRKFRRNLEILRVQDLQKKVVGSISLFMRPKTK